MCLHRETGAVCYMLSARKLSIAWGDTPSHWRWIPITGSRFVISISHMLLLISEILMRLVTCCIGILVSNTQLVRVVSTSFGQISHMA
jgi:hypothetical protein